MTDSVNIYDEKCSNCQTVNEIIVVYHGFGPLNDERETANCYSCGKQVASKKCRSIEARQPGSGAAP